MSSARWHRKEPRARMIRDILRLWSFYYQFSGVPKTFEILCIVSELVQIVYRPSSD